jgi:hypothetical protein
MNIIRISAAVVILIAAGLVHGAWTNRWGPSPELAALATRFDCVPMKIGDWSGTPFELPPNERAMAGAVACLARRYSNQGRGQTVTVLLLGGLPGDISTHTPAVCYPGAGYTLSDPSAFKRKAGEGDRQAEFQTAVATRGGTRPSILRIFWSWNASKGWSTPDDARWQFAAEPALSKLYVIRETAGAVVDPASDPCNDFMDVFLPELERLVFSAPE